MSDEASACPQCGAPNRDRVVPITSRWWFWLVSVVFVLLGASLVFEATTPQYEREAMELRMQCEKAGLDRAAGNRDACRQMERELKARKGCPKEAPNCSWGGK